MRTATKTLRQTSRGARTRRQTNTNIRRPPLRTGQNQSTQPDQRTQQQRDEDLAARVGRTEAQRIKQEELKNEVKRSAAEINWEYAVIQRMDPQDLSTHLVPFNLGKAIAGDESQNVILEPGDVITIFSQNDMQVPAGQQTKFVRLEGEFVTAGVYQVQPGETLRQLIARVGRPNAAGLFIWR